MQQPGGKHGLPLLDGMKHPLVDPHLRDRLLQHFHRHASRTEQGHAAVPIQQDHGGFQPVFTGSAVQNRRNPPV